MLAALASLVSHRLTQYVALYDQMFIKKNQKLCKLSVPQPVKFQEQQLKSKYFIDVRGIHSAGLQH